LIDEGESGSDQVAQAVPTILGLKIDSIGKGENNFKVEGRIN
jgi:hypothetical protein